jgi:hypothetical protein
MPEPKAPKAGSGGQSTDPRIDYALDHPALFLGLSVPLLLAVKVLVVAHLQPTVALAGDAPRRRPGQ